MKKIDMIKKKTRNIDQIFSVYYDLLKVSSVGKLTFKIILVSFPIILTALCKDCLDSRDSLSENLRY